MAILRGIRPIRQTIGYLRKSNLLLKPYIKVFTVHHNPQSTKIHEGLSQFVFWHWSQLMYKNPDIFFQEYRRLTPNPFIRVFHEDGSDMVIDCDSRTKEEIYDHVRRVCCKNSTELQEEQYKETRIDNPGNFGWKCMQNCICEIPGQIPCSGVIPVPFHMRGKYKGDKEIPDLTELKANKQKTLE